MRGSHVDNGENSVEVQRRNGVQSINRAVAILRCFDGRKPELGISEIARSTGLSTSTVHRLLSAMQDNHLVRQTGTKRYGLGPLLLQLANSGAMPRTLREAALSVHDGFARRVRRNDRRYTNCTEITGSSRPRWRAIRSFAGRTPISARRSGWPTGGRERRSWPCCLPQSSKRHLREPIQPITTATTVAPAEIEQELQTARLRGYAAVQRSTHSRDLRCRRAGVRPLPNRSSGHSGRRFPRFGWTPSALNRSEAGSAKSHGSCPPRWARQPRVCAR